MGSPPSRSILSNLSFSKSSVEIRTAVREKLERIRAKITEREGRIATLRSTYEITDTDMIQLLSQQARDAISNARITSTTYSVGTDDNTKIIGAGVVQNLMTEQALIEQEREQITRLDLVVRNLRPLPRHGQNGEAWEDDSFDLGYSDLEFLGF